MNEVSDEAAEGVRRWLMELARLQPDPAYEALLRYGRGYKNRPRPTGLRKRADKRCYMNTALLVAEAEGPRRRRYGIGPLVYVEGFASCSAFGPVQHAWAADPHGNLVDVTWKFVPDAGYFGIPFRIDRVRDVIGTGMMSPLLGWPNKGLVARDPSEWLHSWACGEND